jgi:hypothetical protein
MTDTADPRERRRAALERAVLEGPGALDPALRQRAAAGEELPPELRAFADKVCRHAYQVTDEDVRALRAAGYSEDAVLDLTLSLAVGAARRRLAAALAVI